MYLQGWIQPVSSNFSFWCHFNLITNKKGVCLIVVIKTISEIFLKAMNKQKDYHISHKFSIRLNQEQNKDDYIRI